MKNNNYMIIIVLVLVVASAVGGYIYYKSINSGEKKDPIVNLTYNADGTLTETPVSQTENFIYITNEIQDEDEPLVSSKTGEDEMEFQYYTDKTTRGSVWNGMRNLSSLPDYVARFEGCTAPGCKRISASDKQGMETMLNDAYTDMKRNVKEVREFLVSKELHTTEAFVAKYNQYNSMGYFEYLKNRQASENADHQRFMFDVLVKGFAEYKNVLVPATMTATTYAAGGPAIDAFKGQLGLYMRFSTIVSVMHEEYKLSPGPGGRKLHRSNGEKTVEYTLGVNYPLSLGVLMIPTILTMKEGKTINSVTYNPPANVLTVNALIAAMTEIDRELNLNP